MPLLSSIRNAILPAQQAPPLTRITEETEEAAVTKYREFVPQELPEEYRKFTPEWLYSRIDWRLQAQELRAQDMSNTREKLRIGLTIAVIAFSGIILLCVFAIAMGGKG